MRRTVQLTHGAYTGAKCPACPVVVQAGWDGTRKLTLREALTAHWAVCHPDRPPPT